MKLRSLVLSTLLFSSVTMADTMTVKQEGIKYIKMLGGTLKMQLQSAMKEDKSGLTALAFCTSSANEITKEVNKKLPSYARVRRTSLKVRNNTVNTPDALDIKIMKAYEADLADKTFSAKDFKVAKAGDVTRVYKPLVTKDVCLKCHGIKLDSKIAEAVKSSFPHDKATGYKVGDLRGVIVSEIKDH